MKFLVKFWGVDRVFDQFFAFSTVKIANKCINIPKFDKKKPQKVTFSLAKVHSNTHEHTLAVWLNNNGMIAIDNNNGMNGTLMVYKSQHNQIVSNWYSDQYLSFEMEVCPFFNIILNSIESHLSLIYWLPIIIR